MAWAVTISFASSCTFNIPPPAPRIIEMPPPGETHLPIGDVLCGDVSRYTGVVIGDPRIVLTIGHFLPDFPRLGVNSCKFVSRSPFTGNFRSRISEVISPYDRKQKTLEEDWAILILDEPVPTKPMKIGNFSLVDESSEIRLMRTGGPWNNGMVHEMHDCEIQKLAPDGISISFRCFDRVVEKGTPMVLWDGELRTVFGLKVRHNNQGVVLDGDLRTTLLETVSKFGASKLDTASTGGQP